MRVSLWGLDLILAIKLNSLAIMLRSPSSSDESALFLCLATSARVFFFASPVFFGVSLPILRQLAMRWSSDPHLKQPVFLRKLHSLDR